MRDESRADGELGCFGELDARMACFSFTDAFSRIADFSLGQAASDVRRAASQRRVEA